MSCNPAAPLLPTATLQGIWLCFMQPLS